MDARTPGSDATKSAVASSDELQAGTEQKLSAYGRARRRRERTRKIVRGAIGIAFVLVLWHVMSIAYDLQLILPTPLSVARNVFNTLTLNYDQRWLYGPNIYEHLTSSFSRAITGFTLAAAVAIPLGLIVGRIRAVRELSIRSCGRSILFRTLRGYRLRSSGSGSATPRWSLSCYCRVLSALLQYRSGRPQHQPVLVDAARC